MVLCIVIHVMPEYALDWVPGSGICLYQETLYRSVSCRRRLRRTAPCETPGMAVMLQIDIGLIYCSTKLMTVKKIKKMVTTIMSQIVTFLLQIGSEQYKLWKCWGWYLD